MARRRDDDEDDERPRRRARARDDDEDDERPRNRKRRDDDDDDDDDDGIPEGTPRVFIHAKCGCKTTMPADVIETYLDNPFHFDPKTHCSECDKAVPIEKCNWVGTEESLFTYFEDLQARALLAGNDQRTNQEGVRARDWHWHIITGVIAGAIGAGASVKFGAHFAIGAAIGFIFGTGSMFLQGWRSDKAYDEAVRKYDRKLFRNFYERYPDEKPGKKNKKRPAAEDDE